MKAIVTLITQIEVPLPDIPKGEDVDNEFLETQDSIIEQKMVEVEKQLLAMGFSSVSQESVETWDDDKYPPEEEWGA